MTDAPASAAATYSAAICAGVIGKYGDIDGVWMAPVTAQVMMTLSARFISLHLRCVILRIYLRFFPSNHRSSRALRDPLASPIEPLRHRGPASRLAALRGCRRPPARPGLHRR